MMKTFNPYMYEPEKNFQLVQMNPTSKNVRKTIYELGTLTSVNVEPVQWEKERQIVSPVQKYMS